MKNILVVEDQKLILAVTVDFLAELGYHCIAASDGSEAIEKLKSDVPIHGVVTDVIMYELSGLDVFHAARRRDPNMPVIFVTGYIPEHVLPHIQKEPRTVIVSKPFTYQELGAALASVMPAYS